MPLPKDLPELKVYEENPLLWKDRCKTGIEKLDILLEGGLKNGNVYMVKGPLNTSRIFAWHFCEANSQKKTIYITSQLPYQKIAQLAEEKYISLENTSFIDFFSYGKPTQKVVYMTLQELPTLKDILKGIHSSYGKDLMLVLDNLDHLFIHANEEEVVNLTKSIYIGTKNFGGTTLLLGEKNLQTIENEIDEIITITQETIYIPEIDIPLRYAIHETGIDIL